MATCRCGAALPADPAAPDDAEPDAASSGGSTGVLAIAGILLLAGAAYWFFMRPAPAAPARQQAEAAAPESAPVAAGATTSSPEARAWNAQANAKEISPPDALDAPAPAPSPVTPSAPGSIEEMVDRVMPAVVLIETSGGRGSGFFVTRDTLITNVHVVQNDSYVTLRRNDGSTLNARVESRAPAYDLAVLKVAQPSASQSVIPMGSARSLKPGQEIIVIGSALGTLQNSVSRGVVSGLRSSGGATLVQTDAAANPGNSGGPMLDRNGAVIGITTMGYKDREGLNFGVAIDHARDLIEGRLTDLGAAGGLNEIQAQSRGSESDLRQERGNEQLRARLAQLANAAGTIDAGWQRFRQQCYQTRINGRYDREWFAMLVPNALPAEAGTGCPALYSALDSDIRKFKGVMQQLLNDARQAGVLPGTVRDALRQNRLEFEWDR